LEVSTVSSDPLFPKITQEVAMAKIFCQPGSRKPQEGRIKGIMKNKFEPEVMKTLENKSERATTLFPSKLAALAAAILVTGAFAVLVGSFSGQAVAGGRHYTRLRLGDSLRRIRARSPSQRKLIRKPDPMLDMLCRPTLWESKGMARSLA
jgi:hypothetical protein